MHGRQRLPLGADTIHAYSYYNAKDEYEAKVKSFIAKHLDKQPVEA